MITFQSRRFICYLSIIFSVFFFFFFFLRLGIWFCWKTLVSLVKVSEQFWFCPAITSVGQSVWFSGNFFIKFLKENNCSHSLVEKKNIDINFVTNFWKFKTFHEGMKKQTNLEFPFWDTFLRALTVFLIFPSADFLLPLQYPSEWCWK